MRAVFFDVYEVTSLIGTGELNGTPKKSQNSLNSLLFLSKLAGNESPGYGLHFPTIFTDIGSLLLTLTLKAQMWKLDEN